MGIQGDNGLYWATGINNSGLRNDTRQSKAILSDLTKHAEKQSDQMQKMYRNMMAGVAMYFSITGAKGFLSDVVKIRGEFQQLDVAFRTMLGNKAEADKLMSNIAMFAATTPFNLQDVAKGTKQLKAYQFETEKLLPTMRMLGDVASGLSIPLGDLVYLYGTSKAQTKLMSKDIYQFAGRGIPIMKELADVTGIAEKNILDAASKGQIQFGHLEKVFENLTSKGGMFFNMIAEQSKTITGKISNIEDAWDLMLNKIGQSNEGAINTTIDLIAKAIENYEDILKVLKVVVAMYGTYKGALIAVTLAQKAHNLSIMITEYLQMAKAGHSAAASMLAFNRATLLNPYTAAAAGLALLVGTLVMFKKEIRDVNEIQEDYNKSLEDFKRQSKFSEMIKEYEDLTKKADKTSVEQERFNDLIKELGQEFPDAIKKTNEYAEALELTKDKLEEVNSERKQQMIQDAKDRIEIEKKTQEEISNEIKYWRERTQKEYKRGTAGNVLFSGKETVETTPEIRTEARDKIIELQKTLDSSKKSLKSYEDQLNKLTGKQTDFFNRYSDLFGDLEGETKPKLQSMKEGLEELLVIDINKEYEKDINAQIEKINGALKKLDPKKEEPFDIEEFKKTLKLKLEAYRTYENDVANIGADRAQRNHQSLLEENKSFEEYLEKQLELYKGNIAATSVIADSANQAGFTLNIKQDLKTIGLDGLKIGEEFSVDSKTLKSVEELEKRWARVAKVIKHAIKVDDQIEFGNNLADAGALLQEMAQTAGFFDQELARALGTAGNLANALGAVVSNWSENPIMAATGVVGVLGTIVSLFDNSAEKQRQSALEAKRMLDVIKLQNIALERQIRLMGEASGEDRNVVQAETLDLIDKQIDELNKVASGSPKLGRYNGFFVDLKDQVKSIEDLEYLLTNLDKIIARPDWADRYYSIKDLMDEFGYVFENLSELEGFIDKYYELLEERKRLIAEIIDSTPDSLKDSLMDGLENGLPAIEAFANTFEEAMKRALLKSFEVAYIMPLVNEMMNEIYNITQSAKEDAFGQKTRDQWRLQQENGWTDEEFYQHLLESKMDSAKSKFSDKLKEIGDQWDIMQDIFDNLGLSIFDEESGLAGAIKKELTEQTGSMLAGLMNTMSIDLRNFLLLYQTTAAAQSSSMQQSMALMVDIEVNTRRTADNTSQLADIKQALLDIKKQGESGGDTTDR